MATEAESAVLNEKTAAAAPMNGAELMVDSLIRMGVTHVFTIIGLGMEPFGKAMFERRGEITLSSHVNETNLSLAAQGYARESGRPAFCVVYHASGTALAMMSVTTAWSDRAPFVLISATSSRTTKGRDQYAGIPRSPIEMSTQYTKWSQDMATPERIPEFLARAGEIAATPPMGPVHLSIPIDLFAEKLVRPIPRTDILKTENFAEVCADEKGLQKAARMLVEARNPVILCGSEVGQARAAKEMVAVAEALGAPVITENAASHLGFPTNHPQYAGMLNAYGELISKADVALAVGFEFTEMGNLGDPPPLPPEIDVVNLSVDPQMLSKQVSPAIGLVGHAVPSLRRLAEILTESPVPDDKKANRLAVCSACRDQRNEDVAEARALSRQQSPMTQKQLLLEVQDTFDDKTIVIQAASTLGWLFDVYLEFEAPENFHAVSGKASAQGWGGPTAIGLQLASPDKRVIAILGDGNLMFSATSIWGAALQDLPIVYVVANNGGWVCVEQAMDGLTGEVTREASNEIGWTFGKAPIDFVGFARSLSLEAERVESAEAFKACLEKALASKKPWLIECAVAI